MNDVRIGYYILVPVMYDDARTREWFYTDWRRRDFLLTVFREFTLPTINAQVPRPLGIVFLTGRLFLPFLEGIIKTTLAPTIPYVIGPMYSGEWYDSAREKWVVNPIHPVITPGLPYLPDSMIPERKDYDYFITLYADCDDGHRVGYPAVIERWFAEHNAEVEGVGKKPFFLIPSITDIIDFSRWEYFPVHSYRICYGNMLVQPSTVPLIDFYKSHMGIHGSATPVFELGEKEGPVYLYGTHQYNLSNSVSLQQNEEQRRGYSRPVPVSLDTSPNIPSELLARFKTHLYNSNSTYFKKEDE